MSQLESYYARPPNLAHASKLKVAVWVVSGVILSLIATMREVTIPLPDGVSFTFLPAVNALFNSGAAICLVLAIFSIKQKNLTRHRRFVNIAMALSVLFLLTYVTYHFTSGDTKFGDVNSDGQVSAAELADVGGRRAVYLVLLISHIVLAAVSLPFILMTYVYGFTNQPTKHRQLARWVFPVWLYVAVTGPVCYWMLRPYY